MDTFVNTTNILLNDILPNKWAQAALWVFAGGILSYLSTLVFKHLHFWGASRTKTSLDDMIFTHIKSPIRWSILFVAIYFAAKTADLDSWLRYIVAIEATLAVILWGNFSYKVLRHLLKTSATSEKANRLVQMRTLPLFENLLVIVAFSTGVYFILVVWDINVGPLIASAGILGLAISLAAKDTMANLFAGVFIMADAPYKIGDYIVLDTGERGKVTHIGIRSTRMLTRDDVEVTIPNAIMGNSKVINESAGPYEKYRIRIKVGFAYGSDIQKIREVLTGVAVSNRSICDDPAPRIRFRSFDDSALTFELLCWSPEPELRGKLTDELNEEVYNAVNAAGLKIPFPQRDVHIYNHSQE